MWERIARIIEIYFRQCNLPEVYDVSIPDDCPIEIPDHLETKYARNIYLKKKLQPLLLDDTTFLDTAYWIIQRWGGIRLRNNDSNDALLWEIKRKVAGNETTLTAVQYDRISSLSKVASFLMPEQYAILDSRVAYAINWIFFIHAPENTLFPQPPGRNQILANRHHKTIFTLAGETPDYYAKRDSYAAYLHFLQRMKEKITRLGYAVEYIYEIEMLLYTIATSLIVEDIHERVPLEVIRPNIEL